MRSLGRLSGGGSDNGQIDTDLVLMHQRRVGSALTALGLDGRYRQILQDSMSFDPAPYADSIELGFIEIGYAPGYLQIDGDWRDHRLFAVTSDDIPGGMLRKFKGQPD